MKKLLLIIAIVAQILCIGGLIHRWHRITTQGECVTLEIKPFDPKDLFAGRYLAFDYVSNHGNNRGAFLGEKDLGSKKNKTYLPILPPKAPGQPHVFGKLQASKPTDTPYLVTDYFYPTYLDQEACETYCELLEDSGLYHIRLKNVNRFYLDDRFGSDDTYEDLLRGGDAYASYRSIYGYNRKDTPKTKSLYTVELRILGDAAIVTNVFIDGHPIEEVAQRIKESGPLPESPAQPATRKLASAPIKVACIGDSITAGYKLQNASRDSYPAQLQTLLGDGYQVKNFGRSGSGVYLSTMRGPQEKRAYRHHQQHREALAWQPDILICNLGINDLQDYAKLGGETFRQDYQALIQDYLALPTKPSIYLWAKLAPLGPKNKFYRSPVPFLLQYDLATIAQSLSATAIDMQTPLAASIWTDFPDDLHPNATGAAIIAKTTKAILTAPKCFTLASYCASGMIVDTTMDKPFLFQGTGIPGEKVTSTFGTTHVLPNGSWSIPARAPIPATLTFTSGNLTHSLTNVKAGKLILCVGQSNMALTLAQCDDATSEVTALSKQTISLYTRDGKWAPITRGNALGYSGLALMVGRRYAQKYNTPVGLVMVDYGGAPTESFLPEHLLATYDTLLPALTNRRPLKQNTDYAPEWPRKRGLPIFAPSAIWTHSLKAVSHLPYAAVILYQGESNASTADPKDERSLPVPYMRQTLQAITQLLQTIAPTSPIALVELPGKMQRDWQPYRTLQNQIASQKDLILIKTPDLGLPHDVHPRDKKPIAQRLIDRL